MALIFWFKSYDSNHMVRKERLELSRLTALEPKSSASTNSATLAFKFGIAAKINKLHIVSQL